MLERLRSFFKCSNCYKCKHCGHVIPKEEATSSGWDSQQSVRHIHCPKCGKIITVP